MKWTFPKRYRILCIVLLAAAAVAVAGLYLFLPIYLEKHLLPSLAADLGLQAQELRIRRIGLSGADLGPIRLGRSGTSALAVAAVQIDYSLAGLLGGTIDMVSLSGLEVTLNPAEKNFGLPAPQPSAPSSAPGKLRLDQLPMALNRLRIVDARVRLQWQGRRLDLPIEIEAATAQLRHNRLPVTLRLLPRGDTISLSAVLDAAKNQVQVSLESAHLDLARFGDFLNGAPLIGALDAKGRAVLRLQPLEVTAASLEGRLSGARWSAGDLSLQNARASDGIPGPIVFGLNLNKSREWQWSCAPLQISGPADLRVTALEGTLVKQAGRWLLSGLARTLLEPQSRDKGTSPAGSSLPKALALQWQLSGQLGSGDALTFKAATAPPQGVAEPLDMQLGALKFQCLYPRVELSAGMNGEVFTAEFQAELDKPVLTLPQGRVQAPALTLAGRLTFETGAPERRLAGHLQAGLSQINVAMGNVRGQIPQVLLEGEVAQSRSLPLQFKGEARVKGAKIEDPVHGVAVHDLSAHLPLRWPFSLKAPAGRLSARAILWQKHNLGDLTGTLRQQDAGLQVEARQRGKLFKGLNVLFTANTDAAGAVLDVEIPAYQPRQDIDLGAVLPAAAGYQANGRLLARARMVLTGAGAKGSGSLRIDQGRLRNAGQNLALDNIDMALTFADLPALRSGPSQKLQIGKLELGKIMASDLDVEFQLEGAQSIFIEKAGLKWCAGRLNTYALRIKPGVADYNVTLYCDRLNLAQMLEQLDAAKASGQGAVSGRIPVHWKKGRFYFDEGFLFSTPGQPSVIQMHDTQYLLAGLPPDTPQYTQLDIATEALKDYTYQWAKLFLTSEKDVLLLKLQFDGKPNHPLPFAFNQKLGRFERIQGQGQAEFKGISIDLNFRSPLNDIMQYKELLKKHGR